jgi:hypothetical protein
MFLFLIGTTYLSAQDEVKTEQALQSLAFRAIIVIIAINSLYSKSLVNT